MCFIIIVYDFLKWLDENGFYKDTTVVITGDHLSMQANMYELFDDVTIYDRKMYNVFINSKVDFVNNKNRKFTSFDIYPTTIAALGFKIEGDRLALGTNLYSDKKTLLEEMDGDFDLFNEKMKYLSSFYNEVLVGG